MRILYITPGCFDKGGISRYSRYEIRALQEIYGNDNVKTISMLGPDENQFEDAFEVYWHGNGKSLQSKLKFTSKALGLTTQWKPEVIHAAHVNYSSLINILSKLSSAKTVLNVYGYEVWSNPSAHVKHGLRHVDHIISDCHNTAEYVAKVFRKGVVPDVVWDCVDLSRFKYDETRFAELAAKYNLPLKDQNVLILTLGRLSEDAAYKGYARLIDVFSRVHRQYPQARLIIGGKGNLVPSLQAQAQSLGVFEKVTFTGSVAEKDLSVLYSYADIFSMVTEAGKDRGEGLPLTPLEALACRTPIIVGNHDGSREAVFESQNGFVIDPFDLKEHEGAILRLLQNSELRRQMALNAEALAREHFSYEHFRDKHETIYGAFTSKNVAVR